MKSFLVIPMLGVIFAGGCATHEQEGALVGAGLGAGLGAIGGAVIGHNTTGDTGTGAAIGAGVGAIGGGLVGAGVGADQDRKERDAYYRDRAYDPRYQPAPPPPYNPYNDPYRR